MTSQDYKNRYDAAMMNAFGPPKLVLVEGSGVYCTDADGKRYLDLLGGLAVNSLGHAHPDVVAAIADQAGTLGHVSNFFATPPQIELGERLGALATRNDPGRGAKVFLTNSGTEANETAFKITRRTGRTRLVGMEGAFHGRTSAALALTYNEAYRRPFEPLPGEVTFVPYGDADALAAAVDGTVAAVVLEPIQGEAGVVVPPDGFVRAAREIASGAGALLWIDEVQTGIGRCGEWLDHDPTGVTADLVTVAKGLGGGFPVGACIATGAAADLLGPGSHGTTFGGNPLAARVALTVLDVMERDGIPAHATAVGQALRDGLSGLAEASIAEVRGRGLLIGIRLTEPVAPQLAAAAQEVGYIVNAPKPDVIRLAPPLIITEADFAPFVADLPGLLDQVR